MNTTIEKFYVIGIAIRTSNEDGRAANDIPQLWEQFLTGNVISQIPNKESNAVYSVYTDYEGDYTKPYTTVLGCRVSSLDHVPEGLTGITIDAGNYRKFTAKGKLSDGIVIQQWMTIWNSGLDRTYGSDFEVYGEKAQDPDNAEVDIFVGVKS